MSSECGSKIQQASMASKSDHINPYPIQAPLAYC